MIEEGLVQAAMERMLLEKPQFRVQDAATQTNISGAAPATSFYRMYSTDIRDQFDVCSVIFLCQAFTKTVYELASVIINKGVQSDV